MNPRRVVRTSSRQVYGRVTRTAPPPPRQGNRGFQLGVTGRRFLILGILVALALWGLSQAFTISQVRVIAPDRQADIKASAGRLLEGSWRQQSLLTLDNGALATGLQAADPSLRSVTVRREWPHGIVVTAAFKQPSLGWSSGNQQFLLDRDGTAIGLLPAGSPLTVVVDDSNLPVKVGQRVAPTRFVTFAGDIVPALKGKGIEVTGLEVRESTSELIVKTQAGYKLIMDTTRPVEEVMGDLGAILNLLATQKRVPAEYINLLVPGKGYYK